MQRHFTASAFVLDSKKRVLLLWHKKLQRRMPPGGHVDHDEIPEETAKRECKEETGLDVEIVGDEKEGTELQWFTLAEVERLSSEEIFANVKGYVRLLLA